MPSLRRHLSALPDSTVSGTALSPTAPRRAVRGMALAAALSLALTGGVVVGGPAPSAAAAPPAAAADANACPAAVPLADLEKALAASPTRTVKAHGLTVTKGTTPEKFDLDIIGVLKDGVAPGVDMIMIKVAEGSTVDKAAKGIWSGMSGSPVYTQDGRLVGAVAYGLQGWGPSLIGGVTSAEDMYKVRDEGSKAATTAAPRNKVPLPAELRKAAVAEGASRAAADAGLSRLRTPMAVSGASAEGLDRIRKDSRFKDALVYRASAATGSAGKTDTIVAGGNIASAISYGDATLAGVGTVTAVCGDTVLAFGHPFQSTGRSAYSAHSADAVTIQDSPGGTPFKVANPGGVVGTVDRDRTAAIRAKLGAGPAVTPVRSRMTDRDEGTTRDGVTYVTSPRDLDFATALHIYGNGRRVLDRRGPGSASSTLTVTGTTSAGKPWQMKRSNRVTDPVPVGGSQPDISYTMLLEAWDSVIGIRDNDLADVRITGVQFDTDITGKIEQQRVAAVEIKQNNGSFRRIDPKKPLKVKAGTTVNGRVVFTGYRGQGTQPLPFRLKAPGNAVDRETVLSVTGGVDLAAAAGAPAEGVEAPAPASFEALLKQYENAPRNNDVLITLDVIGSEEGGAPATVASKNKQAAQVTAGSLTIPVKVTR